MKKALFIIALFTILLINANAQSCNAGGCSIIGHPYPTGTFTPTTSWATNSSMNAGNWTLFNVTCGNTYDWTYCSAYGGASEGWDAQLTLYNYSTGSTGELLCFQDNSGLSACQNAPYLRWKATFTGTVQLLTTVASCQSNSGSPYSTLAYRIYATGSCCSYSISPSSISPSSSSGSGSVSVTATTGCSWTAVSNSTSWLTVTSGSSGTGSSTVGYSYTSNGSSSPRTGTITIAGKTFTVTQAGTVSCSYSISPSSVSPSSSSGNGSVSVTATSGCSWTAVSNNTSWLTVTSGSIGTGNGTVGYSYTTNSSSSPRTGTITIAGYTFTVVQSGTTTGLLHGVDISAANGTVSWSQVYSTNHSFAYIKASEGVISPSSVTAYFNSAITRSNPNNVVLGAYHFGRPDFSTNNTAANEAQGFWTNAGNYTGNGFLPPVLDMDSAPVEAYLASGHTKAQLAQWVNEWCTQIYNLTNPHRWPILYIDRCRANYLVSYYQNTINSNIKLWIADYETAGSPSGYALCGPNWNTWPWIFHQYFAPCNTCAGYDPTEFANPGMDQDVFNGDLTAFNNLIGTSSPTASITNVTFPSFVNNGGTFDINYTIEATGIMNVLLGASIKRNGIDYSDAPNDKLVSLNSNMSNYKTRSFDLSEATPNLVPAGIYDVLVALWSDKNGNGIIDPGTDVMIGTMFTSSNKLTINDITNYTISTLSNPLVGGTASGFGTYQSGQSLTLTATANNGYTFTNWTENSSQVSANASYTFTVSGNRTLVANFTQNPVNYTISTLSNPSAGGTTSGGGTYQSGQSRTVIATSNGGYTFTNWTENNLQVSTNASYTFTISGNRTLVANFTQNPVNYSISTLSNPSAGGTISGGGTYQSGQSCAVIASANNGYTFTNWTENSSQVSTNASYTFTVSGNRTLVANFTVSAIATLVVSTNSLPDFGSLAIGGNSNPQTYTISGSNLISDISITAPNGFQFSTNASSNYGTSMILSPSGGVVPNTTIYVRFSPTISGVLSGNISHTSSGSTIKNVSVTGTGATFTIPIIVTQSITNLTTNSALSGGNVTTDGGASITYKGVCWSLSINPTILNSKSIDGTGNGSYSSNISGLMPNTIYHVRAYATNSVGTGYGSDVQFSTLPTAPIIGSINQPTCTQSYGSVVLNGLPSNGTWTLIRTPGGTTINGTGSNTTVSGLDPGTYTFRITNAAGSISGSSAIVTINAQMMTPTIMTSSVINATQSTASSGGSVISDGGSTVTARGLCWSTTSNPTILNSKTSDGLSIGTFTSIITGLTNGVTYHIRAYATNCKGTAYGLDIQYMHNSTSILEIQNDEVSVFPNPVSGMLNIVYKSDNFETIKILNSQGKLISKGKVIKPSQQLDFSIYDSGLYILEFIKKTNEVKRIKVIKH